MNNADISNIEILYCNAKLIIDFIYFLCTKHKKRVYFIDNWQKHKTCHSNLIMTAMISLHFLVLVIFSLNPFNILKRGLEFWKQRDNYM